MSGQEMTGADERGALRELADAAAHEVRGALTAMRGWVHFLSNDYAEPLGDRGCSGLAKIEAGIDRIQRVIEQVYEASPAQPLELDVRALEPEPVLERVQADLQPMLDAGAVALRLGKLEGPVYADPARLYAILLNLVQNALGHMGPDTVAPTIQIDCLRRDAGVEIVVRDNAQGLPSLEKLGIADLFRCGASPRAGTGGLALAVVRRLVRAHGGRVELEHDPDGARFSVHLPDPAPERRPVAG